MRVNILFMDCETNGLYADECSVLSVGAIKYSVSVDDEDDENDFYEVSRFERYYYPKKNENFEPKAIRVNGLTKKVLDEKRKNVSYPKIFKKDFEWNEYIKDVDLFVSHNIEFDREFLILNRVKDSKKKKYFCTMWENTYIIKIEFGYEPPLGYGLYKYPSLEETVNFYKIDYDSNQLHNSLYDCELVVEIFKKMLEKKYVKLINVHSGKYIPF